MNIMAAVDLRIRQVEAFRAVMQQRSVTRAAESLGVSQPAVSRLLADFEANVGFALFARQRGRLVPTTEANDTLYKFDLCPPSTEGPAVPDT